MKIALVTLNDSSDVASWSGLDFHIARALERAGATLARIGPLHAPWTPLMKLRQRWHDATGTSYHAAYDESAVSAIGAEARARLPHDCDAVVAITWHVAAAIGPLHVPLVSWDDSTFPALMGYYPDYRRIARASVRDGRRLGERAARAVQLGLYASEWAADSARQAYNLPDEQVAVVPFGANLDCLPREDMIERAIADRASAPVDGPCRLLWVGVDWERKGGALAVAACAMLREQGVHAELTVAGCSPDTPLPDWVHCAGFISKREPAGEARLAALFLAAHFFILPTRAEAYGLVFAEAAAYGLPAVGIRTGGVPTIVLDGETGVLVAPTASAGEIADRIRATWNDRTAYARLARAARTRAEERLNWGVAGRDAMQRIETLVAGSR